MIMLKVAMNTFEHIFSFLWGKWLGMELLGWSFSIYLTLWENVKLFFQILIILCSYPIYCSMPCSSVHLFSARNTGVSRHFVLQGIFPAQRLNSHLLQLLINQTGSLPLSHLRNPLCSLHVQNPWRCFRLYL